MGDKSSIFDPPGPQLGPETPLDRSGLKNCADCTKNQPRRPHLRPFQADFPNHLSIRNPYGQRWRHPTGGAQLHAQMPTLEAANPHGYAMTMHDRAVQLCV